MSSAFEAFSELHPDGTANRTGIKRARPQLSCIPCRQGKLKCNRAQPACDQCLKRSREASCTYVPPPKSRQMQNMRGRISHLESMMVNLINAKSERDAANNPSVLPRSAVASSFIATGRSSTPQRTTMDEHESTVASLGHLKLDGAGIDSYVADSHWSAILDEISAVKTSLDESYEEIEEPLPSVPQPRTDPYTIVFGMATSTSKEQLLEKMPDKAECDRLVSLWFNSMDPLVFIIHGPTFQEEYRNFWREPHNAPVLWIGLLCCTMATGTLLNHRNTERVVASIPSPQADRLLAIASSAMAMADITKPQAYVLEFILLICEAEYLRKEDAHVKVWLMIGLTVRLALRMGYHRDSSHFPSITPYQGEMRRRVWSCIYQMESLISFALGMPAMVRTVESDTELPHNLLDSDFSKESLELPPERPQSEVTPGSYMIAKSRLCKVFASATALSHAVIPKPYSYTKTLDDELRDAYDLIPPPLKIRPLDQSITDPPSVIMTRMNLEMLYHKTRIIIHRRYITLAHKDARYEASRRICIEAAMRGLELQAVLYEACQPGGTLNGAWWYLSALTTYDFILSAMILCLELNYQHQDGFSTQKVAAAAPEEAQKMIKSLEMSYKIWRQYGTRLTEAKEAANALEIMLRKIKRSTPPGLSPEHVALSQPESSRNHMTTVSSEQSTATNSVFTHTDNDLLSASLTAPGFRAPAPTLTPGRSTTFEDMLDNSFADFDWNMWDHQFQGQKDPLYPDQSWPLNSNMDISQFTYAANFDSPNDGF